MRKKKKTITYLFRGHLDDVLCTSHKTDVIIVADSLESALMEFTKVITTSSFEQVVFLWLTSVHFKTVVISSEKRCSSTMHWEIFE